MLDRKQACGDMAGKSARPSQPSSTRLSGEWPQLASIRQRDDTCAGWKWGPVLGEIDMWHAPSFTALSAQRDRRSSESGVLLFRWAEKRHTVAVCR